MCNNGYRFQSKNVIETARLTSRILHLYRIYRFLIVANTKTRFIVRLTHIYYIYTEIVFPPWLPILDFSVSTATCAYRFLRNWYHCFIAKHTRLLVTRASNSHERRQPRVRIWSLEYCFALLPSLTIWVHIFRYYL